MELVNEFDAEDLIVVDKKGGASTFSRPSAESLGEWLQDYTLGELWKKNILGGRPQPLLGGRPQPLLGERPQQ